MRPTTPTYAYSCRRFCKHACVPYTHGYYNPLSAPVRTPAYYPTLRTPTRTAPYPCLIAIHHTRIRQHPTHPHPNASACVRIQQQQQQQQAKRAAPVYHSRYMRTPSTAHACGAQRKRRMRTAPPLVRTPCTHTRTAHPQCRPMRTHTRTAAPLVRPLLPYARTRVDDYSITIGAPAYGGPVRTRPRTAPLYAHARM